ncbi:unnamed protein product [Urochloa decumbens]|uniref:Pre-mRNA polyadenylation factor Fip1 domain-containing protein n=1 Tax=Urochloa decumbens TaxID=240449 RepID=A0ABC8WR24_9POAL
MADPVEAAAAASAASDNDEEGIEDLYADLDEQVTAALAATGESGDSNARDSDPATDGEVEVPEADANEAVDLGDGTADYSSSDEESDDGLHIVLNDDAGAPPPPPPVGRGEGCVADGEDGEDSCSRVKVSSVSDGGLATVGGFQCKGLLEKTTLPIMGQVDRGHQHVFQHDYNLFLPRNSTIFDIDIEAFQQKPWRQQGVDLTEYFNFNLDEEGWRKYWRSMKQLRMGARSLANGTPGLDQESYKLKSIKAMPKVANYSGFEGRNGLVKIDWTSIPQCYTVVLLQFERRGNELRRVIVDDQKGCLPVGKDLHSSKQKRVRKKNMGYHHFANQDLKKLAYQNQQNDDGEIEEGELIEQDHQDVISKSKHKPEKVVLKSVIETSSAQLQVNDAMAKDAVCTGGATRECDKHILEVMEKMQKRRERFKEAVAPRKDDDDKKELSAVACSTDHIQNQRPARKRRWGGNS